MSQTLQEGSRVLSKNNWEVYHPDGHHMFTCGDRRASWYLERDLAKPIGEYKIKLTFTPKGHGFDKNEVFGLKGRVIRCVVSGEKEGLQRHHIVPYCYRTHFPEEYKSKNHHDIVLVTHKIHEAYEQHATVYKNQLAREYGVKTLNEYNLEYTKLISEYSSEKVKSLSKLHSIFKSYGKIPNHVIVDNLKFVAKQTNFSYEKLSQLNYIQLWKFYQLLKERYEKEFDYFKKINSKKYDHGFHLIQKLNTHQDYSEFIIKWRKHFIETMNPEYMPEGWSIYFRTRLKKRTNANK